MKTKVMIAVAILAMSAVNVFAQENEKRFGIELSGGASFATRELGHADLKAGFGFEGIFHYRFMKHLGVFAGWGWNKFSANDTFAGSNMDFEETGYIIGLQFKHTIASSPVSYYVRAGGLYNHIEMENADGNVRGNTGHGFGWQAACGLDIPLGKNWSITPGAKFSALSRDIHVEGAATHLDLHYISVRIGLIKNF